MPRYKRGFKIKIPPSGKMDEWQAVITIAPFFGTGWAKAQGTWGFWSTRLGD